MTSTAKTQADDIRRTDIIRAKLPADLRQWLDANDIEEIESVVADMTGVARGKILPARKYHEEVGLRLPESIFAQTVSGDYPSRWEVLGEADGDIFLKPDPATVRAVPFAAKPTAVIIHDCYHFDGTPVEVAPRQVLRRVLDLYREKGWAPVVAPEVEFYLVKPNTDADYPLEPPVGRSGRAESGRQAFSIDALNEFDPLFEDLYDYCDIQDIGIETLIHESGVAQMEINLLHGDAWNSPTKCSFSSAGCVKWPCATKYTAPSWRRPSKASPAARCTFTRAWWASNPATTFSAIPTAMRAHYSSILSAACSTTCPPPWRCAHPM